MLSDAIRQKLADPAYRTLHLTAALSLREAGGTHWYDSHFLRHLNAAKHYLAIVRPDALDDFTAGFAPLQPAPGSGLKTIDALFDDATRAKIKHIVATLPEDTVEHDEVEEFGRRIVHDHPYFLELQAQVMPLASELVGIELKTGYNFLSLYGGKGKCDPHMDHPMSMFTLDYCIDQSHEWPIHFSQMVDWPSLSSFTDWEPSQLLNDPAIHFEPRVLQPNQALLFTGSSQWHYRNAITPGGFCNLLFFHYYPAGCEDLIRSGSWVRHFDIPELEALCDLFREERDVGPV